MWREVFNLPLPLLESQFVCAAPPVRFFPALFRRFLFRFFEMFSLVTSGLRQAPSSLCIIFCRPFVFFCTVSSLQRWLVRLPRLISDAVVAGWRWVLVLVTVIFLVVVASICVWAGGFQWVFPELDSVCAKIPFSP